MPILTCQLKNASAVYLHLEASRNNLYKRQDQIQMTEACMAVKTCFLYNTLTTVAPTREEKETHKGHNVEDKYAYACAVTESRLEKTSRKLSAQLGADVKYSNKSDFITVGVLHKTNCHVAMAPGTLRLKAQYPARLIHHLSMHKRQTHVAILVPEAAPLTEHKLHFLP